MQYSSEVEYLKEIDLFEELARKQLNHILQDAETRQFPQHGFLFFQEDPADTFYVLTKGCIKLYQITPSGIPVVLHYLKPGDAFGIIAVLRNIDYPVTAEVVEDCEVLAWGSDIMKRWIMAEPVIAMNAIRILSGHVMEFQNRIREFATEKVERRVARAVLRLAQQTGKKVKNGVQITLTITRQDIAEMAGTTLYTVSRIMSNWENQKILDWSKEHIRIVEPHELVKIAEDFPSTKE